MATTRGFSHIHLFVANIERSLHFYKEGLGMREAFRDSPAFIFLNTPGTSDLVAIHERDDRRHDAGASGGIWHFGFLVDAEAFEAVLDQATKAGGRLIERGVREMTSPYAALYDPDGYAIELYTREA